MAYFDYLITSCKDFERIITSIYDISDDIEETRKQEKSWEKIKCKTEWGNKIKVYWRFKEEYSSTEDDAIWEDVWEFEDVGYIMGVPGFEDRDLECIVHIPYPDSTGCKDSCDPIWIPLLRLAEYENVIEIIDYDKEI